jgi:predicted outer membrane repeat protein
MKMTRRLLGLVLLPCTPLLAEVITVDNDGPADYTTIQAAIDASFEGDTIVVYPGPYLEAIDFLGKAITVESAEGPLETSIKGPAGNTSPTVTFSSGEGVESMISGFSIGGGNGGLIEDPVFGTTAAGGGIYCMDTSPTIFNCELVGLSIDGSGGGMVIVRGDPWVIDCTFVGSTVSLHGGAIYILDNADPLITGCTFENNSASWGGAITCTVSCNPTLSDCLFIANDVFNVGGGMFVRSSSSPVLTNCTFEQNAQSGNPYSGGAGFTVYGGGNGGGPCYPELVNCTFQGNRAQGYGGAVHAAYSGNVSMTGCTFQLNTAEKNGGAISVIGHLDAPTTVQMTSCVIEDNASLLLGGGLDCRTATVVIEECQFKNNMAADTGGGCQFTDSGASSLSDSTVCGNLPDQVSGDWMDLDGNTIEDECAPECVADLNGDGLVDGADLTVLLAAWGECEVIEGCTGDVNADGIVDGADLTAVLGDWGPCL